jgi:hypothetical protein
MRKRMIENRALIDKTIELTNEESFCYQVECGCLFLEKIFPRGSAAYIKHSRNPKYWAWFRLQWYGVEDGFITFLKRNRQRRPKAMLKYQYQSFMEFYCITSDRMYDAFKNYLKVN